MSTPAITARSGHAVPESQPGVSLQYSQLLPTLFARADLRGRVSVLEVGALSPESLQFFSQFKSRIHVRDLFSERLIREQQEDLSEKELKLEFQKLLDFKVGTMLDICLFWDFLNYLSRPALRAFSAALKPYVHAGTRAHGFSVLNVETSLRNQKYGIASLEQLTVRKSLSPQLDYYPHSHEELNQSLSCFNVGRGWLLPDGRLEILLDVVV